MKREFKEGEIIFNNDRYAGDLLGFGTILRDTEVEFGDEFVLTQVKLSGENESLASEVYKLAPNRICSRCGCVVCVEHVEMEGEYPYYCPWHDENLYEIETDVVNKEDFTEYLHDSMERFSDDEYEFEV
jgi:hypothetical protein